MIVSPLLGSAIRDETATIVMVEGEIDGAIGDDRMLIAPYHIHHSDDELFYVLSGRIAFRGDELLIASEGDAVLVPPGSVHSWWNASELPARYLIAMPKRLDDLINALHTAPHSPEEMQQIFADHDSTLLGWTR